MKQPSSKSTIDAELRKYVDGLTDRGHFEAVQVAPASSAEVPDDAGGVRAVVLGVAYPHNGRDGSDALGEAKDYSSRNAAARRVFIAIRCVFIAAEARQLDHLRDAVRAALAWGEIVRDTDRLNLTQSDSALAKAKLTEANETMKTPERGVVLPALSHPGKRPDRRGVDIRQNSCTGRAFGAGQQEARRPMKGCSLNGPDAA